MEILKHGCNKIDDHPEKFKCEHCGCEFEANDEEYYVDKETLFTSSNGYSDISASVYVYKKKIEDTYICSCPECHKIVTKKKERIADNPCITLTSQTTSKECLD